MKSLAMAPLLLALSTALIAQSKTPALRTPSFPAQIKHVVVIVQENRTPDNLFHYLTPLCTIPNGASGSSACTPNPVTTSCYNISPCGLSNRSGDVVPVTLTSLPMQGSTDPAHSHKAFSQMCDPDPANGYACRNDGAWQIQQNVKGQNSYRFVLNESVTNYDGKPGYLLDPYLTYAEQYGWANFMYQTNQGPSYPAHQFLFSGTSARSFAEDANSTFVSENFAPSETNAGCLAPKKATNWLLSPQLSTLGEGCIPYDDESVQECQLTNTALVFPTNPVGSFCDNKATMGSVLDAQSVTWKYYAPDAGDIWTAPNSIQDICVPKFKTKHSSALECTGTEWQLNVDLNYKGADVLNDITNCNLPSVSWVIPNGNWSDHAGSGSNNYYGPSWVTAVINAIGLNPACAAGTTDAGQTFWNNTAIIITWDDWGGWSDHQPAPSLAGLPCTSSNCVGDYQLGFRVPLIVVSAYTPPGYIDNENYDFGSILRTIEAVYGITEGALGVADARATTDLSNFFTGSFRSYTPVPALVDASYFLGPDAQKGPPTPPDNDGADD
ncbi:MAG TPA: alkaline phosphatase family protein [Terriglobales bacterium]|jgi:phospholipase C|nr:alkaline phosphatase family protein [Terriglobales bacterium]